MRWLGRNTIKPYLEYIPPLHVKWNPCMEPTVFNQTDVQNFLSCMARKSSVYVIANLGDKQPCDRDTDPQCPPDGQYQYNTNIVYDPSGNYVTKYHKYNLFYEYQFDKPGTFEVISFQTPFGKFGLITCFDVLFQHPTLDLILKDNITDIAFPTAWMDAEPFLTAIQFHSAFAIGLGINFLSANIHFPESRFHGSGVYTPKGAASYYYDNTNTSGGRLLISTIPVNEKPTPYYTYNDFVHNEQNFPQRRTLNYSPSEFYQVLFHDNFTLIPLLTESGISEVCHNSLCCKIAYNLNDTGRELSENQSDFYALGVFDGLHTYQGQYYIQVCTLIRCHDTHPRTCGQAINNPAWDIHSFIIYGNFSTNYVYPEILLSSNGFFRLPAYPYNWTFKDNIMSVHEPFKSPLTVASMFGRAYEKDLE